MDKKEEIVPVETEIVSVPTGIVEVDSSLTEPPVSPAQLASVTYWKLDLDTILDGLIPDPLPESSGPKDNAIRHLNVIIFGKAATGKTTVAESLAEALARRYGKKNIKALRSSRDLPSLFQNLDLLFSRFRKPPKAVLLFSDDLTKAVDKLSGTIHVVGDPDSGKEMEVRHEDAKSLDEEHNVESMNRKSYWMDKWYDIRGELAKHGMRQGIVLMVGSVHRFYGMPLDIRADADLLLVRSTGTHEALFDSRQIKQMLGPVIYTAMRKHELAAMRDVKELSWTAFVAKTGSGIFRVPKPSGKDWILQDVRPKRSFLKVSRSKRKRFDESDDVAIESSFRKWIHRASIGLMIAGTLAIAFFTWEIYQSLKGILP